MKVSRLALAVALSASSTAAIAAPQSFNTARSFAMGGTGVAIAHPATANSANPAMLASKHHDWTDDFGLIIPSINARFADEEEVINQIDDIQDTIDSYNNLVGSNVSAAQVQTEAEKLYDQLEALDRDTMRVDVGAGLSLAIPGEKLAVGVFTNANLRATARGNVDDNDLAQLQAVIDANNSTNPSSLDGNLDSSAHVLAAAVIEAGVSFGRSFELGLENPVQLGVSPKYVQLRTYQYTQFIDDFDEDEFDNGDYESSKSGFNLDLGAAYAFGEEKQWNAGIAVKNLIPMELDSEFDTAKGEEEVTLELDPMVTAGIAHSGEYHVVTAEAELTERKAFGHGDDTQWVAVGAEFDAFRFAQLRVGARQNIASNDDNNGIEEDTQFTAGVGLSPFGARLDIAALVSDADVGGSIELGVAF
ncbi:conjugal transfer protein TraF [Marinobacter zhanjiangensis]|uniref:Conjugal transfer protein TraF n=1 Tax=Marinobacter zhanjiangensis TaxID=578215 RepID=A0ABQ3BAB2_9GAMM|nr:conjugal transfer protein TraF [Marinobacter zhanjiangensis]GGY80792.1 conjugal transfer protein TraF [Marinobacter zhanjiangensis]